MHLNPYTTSQIHSILQIITIPSQQKKQIYLI
jgi:hypothetical protein